MYFPIAKASISGAGECFRMSVPIGPMDIVPRLRAKLKMLWMAVNRVSSIFDADENIG